MLQGYGLKQSAFESLQTKQIFLFSTQTGYVAHPAAYSMGTAPRFIPGGKAAEA